MRTVKLTNDPYKNIMLEVFPYPSNDYWHIKFCEALDLSGRMWSTMVNIHAPMVDQFGLPDSTHV